ncbi:reverse transcriptase domain-containing protein [Tanacetum coccineum]|uniref:Reverse transcriptase domain-containing protein n=1 Tax=Tanacetum coccineum TaxID=301880 RepID=A0ABQ5GB79_9ASTR
MDDEPMWAAGRVVAPTPGSAITIPENANEFAIKDNHLTLVKGNQFNGRTKTDPHKHIHEFLKIYDMFKYRDTENKAVRLMRFHLSLTGEAKTWLDELNKGTIKTYDELRTAFISRFFPPALFDRHLREIRAFSQHENESLTDARLRMKEMLQNYHGHNLSKSNIIKIFYHGLSEITHEVLNAAAGGIFFYKTPNQAYQLLEDKKQFNDFMKSQQSTNAFVEETFMDLKTQLKTVAKNHQVLIQNLETKFDRLADKQSGRPSGSFPINPNDQQTNSETPINFDSDDEDEEPTPQPNYCISSVKKGSFNPMLLKHFTYMLELPEELKGIHTTFHISNLKKWLAEGDVVVPMKEIQLEEPVEIVDKEVKRLKQSRIPIVKVCWNSQRGPEFT